MHGSFDKSGKSDDSIYARWGIGFLALPAILAMTLIGLAIVQPAASNCISGAVEAEVAAFTVVPEVTPTQLARPVMEIRTVRAE